MNKVIVKRIALVLLVIAVFALGYLRNFMFISINAQSSSVYYHDTKPALHGIMQFISGMDYSRLIKLKWILSMLFSAGFCVLSLIAMYLLSGERIHYVICLAVYIFIGFISMLFMLSGYILQGFSYHAYNIARNLMHMEQSPILLILLVITTIISRGGYLQKNKNADVS